MEQHDDYVSGSHHYWFQFAGGFIFGARMGAYVSSRFFESGVIVLLVSVATALLFGFYCGSDVGVEVAVRASPGAGLLNLGS